MAPLIVSALSLAAKYVPDAIRHFSNNDTAADVADKVIDIAQTVTGTKTPEAAEQALALSPELAVKFKLEVMANDAELEKAYLAGVENARDRDIKLHQTGFTNRRADVMVALDVLGLIACLAVLVFFRSSLPGEVVGILSTIAGIFGACLRDAHQFEFGSSRSSQAKDATINRLSGA